MPTIKDVAKEAGVAVETVSRVLNNRCYISQKTKNKVYAAMDTIGYTPNSFAQGLSKKNMDCIAVIVPHVVHPYFAEVISQLEKEASRRNYKVFLYNSNGDEQKESSILKRCQNSFVSGVLLFSADINEKALESLHIPIVLVERNAIGNAVSIQCDNREGGRLAAELLLQRGCRKLLVVGTLNDSTMPGDAREEEFMRVCKNAGASVILYRATTTQYISLEYHTLIETALNEHPDCDGIFATSDLIAAQIIQVCDQKGIRIPEDIKIVGFDDVYIARITSPTLTSIRQPINDIVVNALDAIERLLAGKKTADNLVLPVTLVERESTRPD